jgi:hypothetical protein
MATAAGIATSTTVRDLDEFSDAFTKAIEADSYAYIVAKVERGPEVVDRPTMDGRENKYRFVRAIEELTAHRIFTPDMQRSYL